MVLEVVLDVLAVDDAAGREVPAGEEEGEDGLGEEAAVVCAPDHGWEGGGVGVVGEGVFAVDDGGLGGGDVERVDAACWERPVGRTGPP